jgi:putative transposase
MPMARRLRQESPMQVYHFMNRGVNKKKIFHRAKDYNFYLGLLKEYCQKLNVQIYHYCIMSNHAHLILKTEDLESLSKFGHFTHRRYAYYYCRTYRWSEQVFKRNFMSVPIFDDNYLLECGRYIERNPINAKLSKDPADHPYSSYLFYAEGKKNTLLTESPLYPNFGNNPAERIAAYKIYVCQERQEIKKLTMPF